MGPSEVEQTRSEGLHELGSVESVPGRRHPGNTSLRDDAASPTISEDDGHGPEKGIPVMWQGACKIVQATRKALAGSVLAVTVTPALWRASPPAGATATSLCTGYTPCAAAGMSDAGYGAASGTSYWTMYAGHNCTNYVAYRLSRNGVAYPGNLGSAGAWAANARAFGFAVDSTPAVGSVAWFAAGHVAYVEAVDANGIVVSEDNWNGDFHWKRLTPGGWYPNAFIHFRDMTTASAAGYEIAFQANTGDLWRVGNADNGPRGLGMMPGTSPAITGLAGGGYEIAFQANTGELWTVGTAGSGPRGLGMMPGTSPAIAGLAGGGYEIAFQANTGELWTLGTAGSGPRGLGMKAGTSPAIAGLAGGGYEIAFQANTGELWRVGSADNGPRGLGMKAGSSPAIAHL